MLTPSITFTDDTGAVTIISVVPRFGNWSPDVDIIGPSAPTLGTGVLELWEFRRDYWAAFEMPEIPPATLGDLARFKTWLLAGGSATLATNDAAGRT